jgi:uncharacterized protein
MEISGLDLGWLGLAAVAGGAVNALGGGGTLITFPALTAIGIPAVAANVTNTVALCPGYLGATWGQRRDLAGQRLRVRLLAPIGAIGGILGGVLLLCTGEQMFRALVPYLILLAVGLLALDNPLRKWESGLAGGDGARREAWAAAPVFLASIYGGYFGAGMSVIVLAVLALALHDSLTRLNALKQSIAFSVNMAAALFFLFSGKVVWSAVLVMSVGSLAGGVAGGMLAGWVRPAVLRAFVVVFGIAVAVVYFVR